MASPQKKRAARSWRPVILMSAPTAGTGAHHLSDEHVITQGLTAIVNDILGIMRHSMVSETPRGIVTNFVVKRRSCVPEVEDTAYKQNSQRAQSSKEGSHERSQYRTPAYPAGKWARTRFASKGEKRTTPQVLVQTAGPSIVFSSCFCVISSCTRARYKRT